jgi:superfamily I DNA/RNA helicase
MDYIRSDFKAVTLPLSVSYRCSKAVVAEAHVLEPVIQPSENAPDGLVAHLETPPNWKTFTGGILCRNNAPLVRLAYHLAREQIAFTFRGRDFARGLTSIIDKLTGKKTLMMNVFRHKLETWKENQLTKRTVGAALDKYAALIALMDEIESGGTTESLKKLIVKLFTNNERPSPRTLSSIHQAKGLEWENVVFYAPELIPSFYATQPWQRVQEDNLKYVGITRARNNLYFLPETRQ